jgi:DNA-binding MarR family transcriptional regulator
MENTLLEPFTYEISSFVIERTAKRMKLAFSRVLHEHADVDITVDQWVIVQILDKNGMMSQMELAEESFKDAPTITRILDILESKKLITRTQSLKDRRKFVIALTKAGEKIVELVNPLVKEFRAKAYLGFNAQEFKKLEDYMERIEENIVHNMK